MSELSATQIDTSRNLALIKETLNKSWNEALDTVAKVSVSQPP